MKLTITTDFPSVQRAFEQYAEGVRNKAMPSALNKVMAQAKTAMQRGITQEFAVSAAYARDRLRVTKATAKGGAVNIEATLVGGDGKRRSANIIAFAEKQTTLAQAKKRGKAGTLGLLHVRVKRGGQFKPVKGAFIGNKGRTVFEREGKGRLPIKPVQTIDIASMFNTKRINAAVLELIRTKLPGIFQHEAEYFSGLKSGGGRP